MVKARSPGYPSISLGEAVEKITLVYKNDYQNKIPRPVVAQHAGYKSMNGRALSVLASLSKYGLLEGRGEENWVSDLALQIIAHQPKSQERRLALAQAADTPELFQEISARFPSGASEAALKSYLMTRKFIPDAADIVARCYRETKQFVIDEGGAYNTDDEPYEDEQLARSAKMQVAEIAATSPLPLAKVTAYAGRPAPAPAALGTGGVAPSVTLNEPRVFQEGKTMRIEAWVDAKGIKKLVKRIEAMAPFLDEDED
jgi:hypothetical protein